MLSSTYDVTYGFEDSSVAIATHARFVELLQETDRGRPFFVDLRPTRLPEVPCLTGA